MKFIISVLLLIGLLAFVGLELLTFISTILDKKKQNKDKEDIKK